MNQEQTEVQKHQALLTKLNKEIEVAQDRRDIAKNTADSLEARNKSVIASIEAEGNVKKKFIVEEADKQLKETNDQIAKLGSVRNDLLTEINDLNTQRSALSEQIDAYMEQKDALNADIDERNKKLLEMDNQLLDSQAEMRDNRGKIADLREGVATSERQYRQREQDRLMLDEELNALTEEIVRTDEELQIRKRANEKAVVELNNKLQQSLDSLTMAQNQDKDIRESWATGHAELDRRTEAVRKMEAKLGGAEARIAELSKYGLL